MSSVDEKCETGGFTFVWLIEHFTQCLKMNAGKLISKTFYVADLECSWNVCLEPSATNEFGIKCTLTKTSNSRDIQFECEFCICTTNKKILCVEKFENFTSFNSPYSYWMILTTNSNPFPPDNFIFHCHLRNSAMERTESVRCYDTARLAVHRKSFVCKIQKFTSLLLNNERVITLKPVEDNRPTLTFKISLCGSTIDNAYLKIAILFENVQRVLFFKCRISVVGSDGTETKFVTSEQWLTTDKTVIISNFLSRRELLMGKRIYLPEDVLTLKCKVNLLNDDHKITDVVYGESLHTEINFPENRPESLSQLPDKGSPHTLKEDLELLYESGELSDLKLTYGDRTFPVHRLHLSARSPVFRKMFESNMEKKKYNILCDPNLDSDTIGRMLRYIYTDVVPDDMSWEETEKLYYCSDKYQLLALRQRCSALLGDRLNSSNATETLILADRHLDLDLMGVVQNFIFKCGKLTLTDDKWMLLEQENPLLALKTMRNIILEKEKNTSNSLTIAEFLRPVANEPKDP